MGVIKNHNVFINNSLIAVTMRCFWISLFAIDTLEERVFLTEAFNVQSQIAIVTRLKIIPKNNLFRLIGSKVHEVGIVGQSTFKTS